jgi:peptide/nickel transport system ATP-binding protein
MHMTRSGQPLLTIKQLSVDYGDGDAATHAVVDVSFSLHRGEILGLAGESGSGKSTLAYAISRLLRPPAQVIGGEALYYPHITGASHSSQAAEPMDILRMSPAQLRAFRWSELAIVFQSAMNSLNPVMTVGAQIDDVLRTHRNDMGAVDRQKRAVELLRLVGIAPDRLHSYPHELSGGMRQRAGIAIALALSPDIIIMDEPTTALDVVVQREILFEIMRLRETLHFAVIFITHDLSLLLEIADTVAIMYAGRLVEVASRRDLSRRPLHPYSHGLIHSFPTLHGPRRTALGIPGSPPNLRAVPPGCAFHPRCPLAFAPCSTVLPALRSPSDTETQSRQQVACHLYDPTYQSEPPTREAITAAYETAAERSRVS